MRQVIRYLLVVFAVFCFLVSYNQTLILRIAMTTEVNNLNPKTINDNNKKSNEEKGHDENQEPYELEVWRRKRVNENIYNSFFTKNDSSTALRKDADRRGPILDFAIIGFPKCGTTGMMRTLSAVTTMPSDTDICTPVRNTIYYAYANWANEYGNGAFKYTEDKPLKGSKCPRWIDGSDLDDFGKLPKTNLIVGIRHPVMFFQSFCNQMRHYSTKSVKLEDFINEKKLKKNGRDSHQCDNQLVCVARSRFYLSLARLGKTLLGPDERHLLTTELYQSKRRMNVTSKKLNSFPIQSTTNNTSGDKMIGVQNNVFLFDSNQGKNEYLYQELAQFLKIDFDKLPSIDAVYKTKWSGNNKTSENEDRLVFDICLPQYEHVRKELMPISYTLGRWLLDYFIPASYTRNDVTIPNVTAFKEIVHGYLQDPCNNTLVRNVTDGEYYRQLS